LKVMTIVVVLFMPVVLLYQGWSYHVFRARVGGHRASEDGAQADPEPAGPGPSGSA
jgi:cytochrome d ubiquinol oxidase subunit II